MCGIAGLVLPTASRSRLDADIRAMCDAIRHRGPDDSGYLAADGVALGMRRLSIIDVAGGAQPIGNEDGTVQVVFNGEIYNHQALQARLESAGHRFTSHCDTEALVHLYEERGDAMLRELRGMFGFAIWDARRERLFAARDRLGIKPLYYWETEGGVALASELRSFIALPRFPAALDDAAVAAYLTLGYVPDPQCIFRGVRKLPPGHFLTWSRDAGAQVRPYWTPSDVKPQRIGEREAVEELRRLLADAVGSHLESEVPLGAFLSGGIDSSTVVAQMARLQSQRVRTFSIGFDEPEFNESPDALAVAEAIGTDHTQLIVRPDVDLLIEEVVHAFDEPFADSSALPTYLVSALARQQVTVALSGDGGDELFAGYTRYAEAAGQSHVSWPLLQRALRAAALLLPHGAFGRNRLLDLTRSRAGRYASTVAQSLAVSEGGVARSEVAGAGHALDDLLREHFQQGAGFDFVTQLTVVDMATYLPGDILTKVDRMSMASSLEARVPLLDHPLVEFALSLPAELKLRDGTGKWVLRRAIEGMVPGRVLTKPKQGFAVPLDKWLRGELRHRLELLEAPSALIREYVDAGAVRRLVREHLSRRRDHAGTIWRLLVLELWLGALRRGDLGTASERTTALDAIVGQSMSF